MTKVAWITGGSRGIGRAAALRLAGMGMDVAVGYHREQGAADDVVRAVGDAGQQGLAVSGDMGDAEAVGRAHEAIVRTLGPVDVLVASHGIYTRTPVTALDLATWQRTLDVNLTGAFLVTQAVLPQMRKNGWGRIVYLGSIIGRIGSEQGAHYAATKAGLFGLCRSIALDAAREGVTANVVAPSMIETDILASDTPEKRAQRKRDVPVGRIGTAEECAAAIVYLVSDEAGYVTGTELRLDGGFRMG